MTYGDLDVGLRLLTQPQVGGGSVLTAVCLVVLYDDSAGNTVVENSSVFSLIRMR